MLWPGVMLVKTANHRDTVLIVVGTVLLCGVACQDRDSGATRPPEQGDVPGRPQVEGRPPGESAPPASNRPPDRPSGPQAIWDRSCARCHPRSELEGATADQIRTALREVFVMRRYAKMLTDADIEALGQLLSPDATPGEAPTPPPPASGSERYAFRAAKECRRCHPGHVEQWEHSLHALAHVESVYDRYFIKASMETDQQIETFCAGCHTPIGVYEGTIPFARPPRKAGDTRVIGPAVEGVGCEFCHSITGHKAIENGEYVLRPAGRLLGPLKAAKSTFHDTEHAELYRRSEYCGVCHNVTHPANGIVLEATFSEWQRGPWAQEGVGCQDCHMTDGLFAKQVHPGKVAEDGPPRRHVSKHFFVGPNILFSKAGGERLRELSLKLMRGAGRVTINAPTEQDGALEIPIDVANTGTGHYLPSGITEVREMWLEVVLVNARGEEVFHSGALDQEGILDAAAVVYRTDVVDASGNVTTKFWNAVAKRRDHRIPPRETITERIAVPASDAVKARPLTIRAALRYRSVSPAGLAEVDAPADLVEIPVITISEAELRW